MQVVEEEDSWSMTGTSMTVFYDSVFYDNVCIEFVDPIRLSDGGSFTEEDEFCNSLSEIRASS